MKTFATTLLAAALLAAPAAFAQQYGDTTSTHSQHQSGTSAQPATSSTAPSMPAATGTQEASGTRQGMDPELPATASPLPLLGLLSLVSLGSGLLLRLRRRD